MGMGIVYGDGMVEMGIVGEDGMVEMGIVYDGDGYRIWGWDGRNGYRG